MKPEPKFINAGGKDFLDFDMKAFADRDAATRRMAGRLRECKCPGWVERVYSLTLVEERMYMKDGAILDVPIVPEEPIFPDPNCQPLKGDTNEKA